MAEGGGTDVCTPRTGICAPQPPVCAPPIGICAPQSSVCAPYAGVCAPPLVYAPLSQPYAPAAIPTIQSAAMWQGCGSHRGQSKSRFTLSKVNKTLILIGHDGRTNGRDGWTDAHTILVYPTDNVGELRG
jgi:hypothetical protein